MHRCPVDVINPRGQPGQDAVLGRDAKQPATQPVRIRQLRGIGHGQAGSNENVASGGDRCVGIRP